MTFSGALPTVDAGHILQERSLRALRHALPPDEYIFRDERIDDYGVDGTIELLLESKATAVRVARAERLGQCSTGHWVSCRTHSRTVCAGFLWQLGASAVRHDHCSA